MQSTFTFRTNRDLFSNHYLTEHLPETEPWEEVPDDEVEEAREAIQDLYASEQDRVDGYNEAQLERQFIRPVFEELGITFEIEESVKRGQRRPDYAFFADEGARENAFERRDEGGNFYENAIAVADAKRWGRKLDTRGERERDFENPSYQIHVYLQETPTQWAVLTNGKKWRIYYGPTSHRLDSYYEIDLPTLLEQGGLEEFRYFYLFFRREAFVEDASGDCFLDDVYDESNTFAEALGEDLQDNIYEAIRVLGEGFLQRDENDLSEETLADRDLLPDNYDSFEQARLDLIHDSSLIYLYRLIFVLYAESEGRELLPTDNDIYSEHYSLNQLKQTVAGNLDDSQEHYLGWKTNLWDTLGELFDLINEGSESRGIDREQLYIPAYNGGLFRTNPDEDDSAEAKFLASHEIGDTHLAEVLDLLTRRDVDAGTGRVFVDYSSLDIRHLGSIYEGLLEYQLNVADEPLALDDGEYIGADKNDNVVVAEGDVYLTTDSGERKATGSYYTPEYVVEYIVENTLGPLVDDIREDFLDSENYGAAFAEEFANRVFDLKILDPAMGSGHFLTSAVDYLAREIINAQERQAEQQGVESIDQSHDINWARRQVAQRCIYGVDLNPPAVELAKVSLWLRTLAAEQPLAFLDHHLKTGNSLVGSDIEDVLSNGESNTAGGQLTLQQSFARTRQQALEHVMDRFHDLLSIDNESLEDIKEMEAAFEEVRDDPLYQHLLAMANVHTAEEFGLDVPGDAYERMAEALRDDSWNEIAGQDWFETAQAMAEDEHFFHWELEFPVVFYQEDGERKSQSGFDVVIGNPPYVEPSESMEGYLRSRYEVTEYFVDLFHTFIERGTLGLRNGGEFGFIVPEPWLTIENKKLLREFLLKNTNIEQIVRFSTPVFDDATVDTVILHVNKRDGDDTISIAEMDNAGNQYNKEVINELSQSDIHESEEKRIDTKRTWEETKLLNHIWDQSIPLESIADLAIGVQAYNSSKHTQEQIENKVFHSSQKESEEYMPQISGEDVDRYRVKFDGNTWIKYGSHLHDRRDKRYLTGPRILVRQIPASGKHKIQAAFTDQPYCNYNTVLNILVEDPNYDLRTVLAILNSTLMSWIFPRIANSVVTDSFPKLSVVDLQNIPIKQISDDNWHDIASEHLKSELLECLDSSGYENLLMQFSSQERTGVLFASISELTQMLEESISRRSSLNLSLADYLGNYEEGPDLPDVGLFQPTSSTILDATTEEYDNLRVGDVKTVREDHHVTIHATARYKPENEDEYETDQWGYTETDYHEAFALTDLSEEEAALVEAFVPVAVEKANGFAGFRDNATKTNSPIDRLKAITLPDPDDVADDLRRYMEVKEQAEELDEKIEKTDQFIDEIVYDLYDLTDEEIEMIESTVQDD